MKYTKKPFGPEEHIVLLQTRGLHIPDPQKAIEILSNTGYFRLTGYMHHLQINDGSHAFKNTCSFDDLMLHYQFDKNLRTLFIDYLERIEVALKAKLTDKFCVSRGFYWYDQIDLFANRNVYYEVKKEITKRFDQAQEPYLKSFKSKYVSESCPPSNMAMEILSFGKLSRLYEALKNGDEKMAIASEFNIASSVLSSWLTHITNVRNVCAHHSRLWNRRFTANRPVIPSRKGYKFHGDLPSDFNSTVYGIVCIIDRLLRPIEPGNAFLQAFLALISRFPTINTRLMGFPERWTENPAWK